MAGYWYITHKDTLDGAGADGDLYSVESQTKLPPTSGWQCAKDGLGPPPVLQPYYPSPTPHYNV